MPDSEFVLGKCQGCGLDNRQLHPRVYTDNDACWCIECIPIEERLRVLQVSPLIDFPHSPSHVQVSLQCEGKGCVEFLCWQARPPRSLDTMIVLDCVEGGCNYTCQYEPVNGWRYPFKPGDKLASYIALRLMVTPELCLPRAVGSIGRHRIELDGETGPLMIWEYDDEPPMHHPVALTRVPRCETTPMWFVATQEAVHEILVDLGFRV